MGGNAPLGYIGHERTLKILPDEAETIRHCFSRYLELGSVHVLQRELKSEGVVSRIRTASTGRTSGGQPLGRGQLFHLLKNRVYVGEIVHGDKSWPGLHDPIIDRETFDAVQALLSKAVVPRRERARSSPAALVGLVHDAAGGLMSPVTARKGGSLWRYYVSAKAQRGAPVSIPADGLKRVAAIPLEELVAASLRELTGHPMAAWSTLRDLVSSVTVYSDRVALALTIEARTRAVRDLPPLAADGSLTLVVPARLQKRAGRVWLEASASGRVERRRVDRTLVAALRRAHLELGRVGINAAGRTPCWRDCKGIDDGYIRAIASLAFLAPDIQEAIMEGRQPVGMTLQSLRGTVLPLSWEDQRTLFGTRS